MLHAWLQFEFLLCVSITILAPTSSVIQRVPADIHKYFVNQTLASRQYACSEEERACFGKQQLLFEGDGRCYAVGARGPCRPHERFHADKREASRLGGHLRGRCQGACADASRAPLAATGRCLTREEVEAQVCRSEWYLRAAKDAFGEWVCEWTRLPCSPPAPGPSFAGFYDGPHNGICSAPDILRHSTTNSSIPDESPVDHPLLVYFTDKSYRDREFPCSEEERECLQYGRVLHSDGNCYRPGEWLSNCEPGEAFHVDAREAAREGGRLLGTCRSPCRGFAQPHIVTGQCTDFSALSQICRWDWGMNPTQNAFGQMACQCSWKMGTQLHPPPTVTPPATTPGHCKGPDFSNPVTAPTYDNTLSLGFSVPCSDEEFVCLKQGRVLAGGACHALRTRGPCPEDQELVLDKDALAHARLLPTCVAQPCPVGSVRLPVDGRCLVHRQAVALLCPRQNVALDEFGGWQCDFGGEFPANLTTVMRREEDGACELPSKFGFGVGGFGPGSAAGAGAGGGGGGGWGGGGSGGSSPPAVGGFGSPARFS